MVLLLVALIVDASLLPAPAAPRLERGRAMRPAPVVLATAGSTVRRSKAAEGRPAPVLAPPSLAPGDGPAAATDSVYVPPCLAPRSPRVTPSSQRDPPGPSPVG